MGAQLYRSTPASQPLATQKQNQETQVARIKPKVTSTEFNEQQPPGLEVIPSMLALVRITTGALSTQQKLGGLSLRFQKISWRTTPFATNVPTLGLRKHLTQIFDVLPILSSILSDGKTRQSETKRGKASQTR